MTHVIILSELEHITTRFYTLSGVLTHGFSGRPILITNLCIGLLTPPVGTCLFVGAGVGHSDIMRVSRAMVPFYLVMVLALLVITFWAPLSLFLPGLFQ